MNDTNTNNNHSNTNNTNDSNDIKFSTISIDSKVKEKIVEIAKKRNMKIYKVLEFIILDFLEKRLVNNSNNSE